MRVLSVAVAMLGCVALVTACDSTTGDPKPSVAPSTGKQVLFDPCAIPSDVLRQTGVDPATAEKDIGGVKQDGWKLCTWKTPVSFLIVFATDYTFEDVKANPNNTDFRPVGVGQRQAVMYREVSDKDHERCDIALDVQQGAIIVRVLAKTGIPQPADVCAVVTRDAITLDTQLPK